MDGKHQLSAANEVNMNDHALVDVDQQDAVEPDKTHDSSDEGEDDMHIGGEEHDHDHDSTLLDWIKVNKLTFIKHILLQQEISLTEIASLSPHQRRQFVDSLQIENPIFEKRLLNAVLKLETVDEVSSNERSQSSPQQTIDKKLQHIVNAIKDVNDCIEVLKIQMSHNEKEVSSIYDAVIDTATQCKESALNTIAQVYNTKFAVLNVKMNRLHKMHAKIQKYKEDGSVESNSSLYTEIVSFKDSENVTDTISNTDMIRIQVSCENVDEYIKSILTVNDLSSIILPPTLSINDIDHDCISINIVHESKECDLCVTKYELKFSELSTHAQVKEDSHHKYYTQIVSCNSDENVMQHKIRNLTPGTNYVISARLYSSLLSKWSLFSKNMHIKTNQYVNYGGRVILKNTHDSSSALQTDISFMNCIIHCLSNTSELRDYFISLSYINHLHKEAHSSECNIANIFGNILINIWSNRYDTISHSLSQLLTHKSFHNDPFRFLVFLLQTLHNELNEGGVILNQHNKRMDVASLAWKAHLQQNRSKLVDLFHFQYKTDQTCLHCKKHCIQYGVCSYLSLAIAKMPRKSFVIDIFHRGFSNYSIDDNGFNNNSNKPVRHVFHCNPAGIMKDLAKIIAKKYNVKRQFVLFYENSNFRVCREYEHKTAIHNVPNHQPISCYILKDWNKEITAEEVKMKRITLWLARLCHIGPTASSSSSAPSAMSASSSSTFQLFGMPLVLSFISTHSHVDIYKHVYERLYIWLGIEYLQKPPKILTRQQPHEIENEMKTYETDWNHILYEKLPFRLRLIETSMRPHHHANGSSPSNSSVSCSLSSSSGSSSEFSIYDNHGNLPPEIPINGDIFDYSLKSKHIDIVIEWKSHAVYERIKKVMHKVIVDHGYTKWKKQREDKDSLISLYDCIDAYTAKKKYGRDHQEQSQQQPQPQQDDVGFPDIGQMGNDGVFDHGNNSNHYMDGPQQQINNNLFHCPRCKKRQKHTKKIEFQTFPKYLIVHLQRDEADANSGKYVQCPLQALNMSKYRCKAKKKSSVDIRDDEEADAEQKYNDENSPFPSNYNNDSLPLQQEAPIYDLYAVATTNSNKQCSAFIKSGSLNESASSSSASRSSQWYHYSESQITLARAADVISPSTSILFYKRN